MVKKSVAVLAALFLMVGCDNNNNDSGKPTEETVNENPSTFKEIGSITIGGAAAAEISAYDETTKRLFTVNNSGVNRIDVVDLSDPSKPTLVGKIDLTVYNGAANSVST